MDNYNNMAVFPSVMKSDAFLRRLETGLNVAAGFDGTEIINAAI